MYYVNILKQDGSSAKTYEHHLRDERSVVDRCQCHITFMTKYNICYLNFIQDTIKYVSLLVLSHVCPYA